MIYKWKTGSHHKVSADVAGAICDELAREGMLNARTLVEVSRPEDAPLHNEFEWDDAEAAEQFRMVQARNIIHSIIVTPEETGMETRKFVIVKETAHDHNYHPIETVLQNEYSRTLLLASAIRELNAIKRKYASFTELASVFAAIDEVSA